MVDWPALVLCLQASRLISAQFGGRSYIDPGSGSFAIQIIIAAVLGGVLSARLWFRYVLGRIIGVRAPVNHLRRVPQLRRLAARMDDRRP